VDAKQVMVATKSAISQFTDLSLSGDAAEIASTIQGPPMACGIVPIWNGGWTMHYRCVLSVHNSS
jgi:hypothetical protein